MDRGNVTAVMVLHLSAAFNTFDHTTYTFTSSQALVSHHQLVLKHCHIQHFSAVLKMLHSVASFTETVSTSNEQSSTEHCKYEVPQGSVLLRLLLFALYPAWIKQTVVSFRVNTAQDADCNICMLYSPMMMHYTLWKTAMHLRLNLNELSIRTHHVMTCSSSLATSTVPHSRIQYKFSIITFKALTTHQPNYLVQVIQLHEQP